MNETCVFEVYSCVYLGYVSAVTDVVKYCEARVLSKKSKGRGGRRIDEDEHKSLWMSICIVWDDMEGLFAEKSWEQW